MRRRVGIGLLTVVLACAAGAPTVAQPVNRIAAKLVFLEARRLFQAGHYRAAIRAFERAWGYRRHRVIQYNIALSYARLGFTVPAGRHLRQYLAGSTPRDPPLPYELKRVLRRTGVVRVAAADRRAAIFLDGRFVGMGRSETVVRPGGHRVRVRLGSRWIARRALYVAPGGVARWSLPRGGGRRARPMAARPTDGPSWRERHARLHWAWFTGGVATTLATFVTAAAVTSHADRLADRVAVTPGDDALVRDRRRFATAAKSLWGITAALALASATAGVFTRFQRISPRKKTTWTPLIGLGRVGVAVTF